MLRVFIGFDERQRVSFTTLAASIYETSSTPVSITPLILRTLPIKRRGLTPFTFSRFLVPWLCDYEGIAVFMDADMLLVSDINELVNDLDLECAVSVVKSIEKFEQSSFMVFNCGHPANKKLTPDYIEGTADELLGLSWLSESEIGALHPKWNQLVGYQEVQPQSGNLHFTMGVPAYEETATCDHGQVWTDHLKLATSTVPWAEIMGSSVHAVEIDNVKLPRYVWDFKNNQANPKHLDLIIQLIQKKSS